MRVLHISDVHVDVPLGTLPLRTFADKRLIGAGNLVLRRGRHFRRTREKLAALDRLRQEHAVDLVICTGDYTVLGTDPELAAAREAIAPLTSAPGGFVTVPGNHDVYVPAAIGGFEREFGDLLGSDWPDAPVDGVWPLVRIVGDTVAVIAVNSARPNPQPWRSSGRIPDPQIARLREILADPRLTGRFVFVITHYAPRLEDGRPDHFGHGLSNADAFLDAVRTVSPGAVLHGHVHRCFSVRIPGIAPPLFGAGSTTQDGREGLWMFEVDGARTTVQRGGFRDGGYHLVGDPVSWDRVGS